MEIWIDQYGKDGGWDGRLDRYELEICEDQAGVARIVEALTRPAERREVAPRLTQLAETLPSQGDAGSVKWWMESVWEAVEEFPADVINQALKEINRKCEWRPVPAVVLEQCRWVGRKRLALKAMVRRL